MPKYKIEWDKSGERFYETGTDHGVLYPYGAEDLGLSLSSDVNGISKTDSHYGKGVAWNGLTAVTESPSGADATDLYADNIKYLSMRAAETFGYTIEAYTYPEEFAVLDGSASLMQGVTIGQQSRGTFGFCYRSIVGNDTEQNNYGYKLHLIYGSTASPSERGYSTVNDSPEAITFSWECETTPVNVTVGSEVKTTATVTIDVSKLESEKKTNNLPKLLNCLYGSDSNDAFLPLPDEVKTILEASEAV